MAEEYIPALVNTVTATHITSMANAWDYLKPTAPDGAVEDYLIRITSYQQSGGAVNMSWTYTAAIVAAIQSKLLENHTHVETLAGVIRWQHNLLEYNGHYNAFLLGQLNEPEFEEIAGRFAYQATDIPSDTLIPRIKSVLALTDINYTPGDFADLFRCNIESVVDAIQRLSEEEREKISE